MNITGSFAEKLENARRLKRLTQAEIAKKMGVSQQVAANYLKGKGFELDIAKALADAVGEDFLEILGTVLPASSSRAGSGAPIDSPQVEGTSPHPPGDMNARKMRLIEWISRATPDQVEQMEATASLEDFAANRDQSQVGDTPARPRKRRG